ncbi:catalase [Corynebacterium yudongzhengii]|uniref:Catalase n=1 Tax=Corynebacterium yudongzhengii TaxID=2080740 RepID=A0A2U1T5R6_9CORY|nr:catalase [Corynebacterium yudongzhengii]AWB81069.1 catalase [Corynebacterium yudongzhengii]PWC01238.1 catalase [Corynebacterium yudongzhengii]
MSNVDDVLNRGLQSPSTDHTQRHNGAEVASENHSITQGRQGAVILDDIHLIEKLAHFNREMVPDRIPHAKGHGAFGELHVTEDVSQYTKAQLFQPGTVTPMAGRFSTVAGESGSPDTWRDVHGFALRFYTEEGNYDIVGNNTPVFFVRDPMKFPDFIHSQKRHPQTGLRDADMQWDFWTRTPESAHQVTYLMGGRGTPKTTRHQNGYGSHTFQWINKDNEAFWVKYHFISQQGVENFTDAEAEQKAGENADYHREDLFNAIENGDYPRWDVYVQVMPVDEAENYRYNPFDLTKTWSKKDYPRIKVGYFELNRNPINYFAQIEQLALDPGNLVPGIGFSPDKMLQGRVFAYADQQRYRIGPNYRQLPVNRPLNDIHNYSQHGQMNYEFQAADRPPYTPNKTRWGAGYLDDGETSNHGDYFSEENVYGEPTDAMRGADHHGGDKLYRGAYVQHEEDGDFVQPGILYREVMDDEEKEALANNIAGAMAGVSPETEERCYWYWSQVDEYLGNRVKEIFTSSK